MTPEQEARVSIDTLLQQVGWHVRDMVDANIHAARGRYQGGFHNVPA